MRKHEDIKLRFEQRKTVIISQEAFKLSIKRVQKHRSQMQCSVAIMTITCFIFTTSTHSFKEKCIYTRNCVFDYQDLCENGLESKCFLHINTVQISPYLIPFIFFVAKTLFFLI